MIREMKTVDSELQVFLSGSMYVQDAKELREALEARIAKGQVSLLIDLSQVDYIDSTGLGTLIALRKQALQNGGAIRLQGLQGIVRDLFEMTRLTTVFEVR